MSLQLKIQVLAITPIEARTFSGRKSHSRAFQCFVEGKVAVHTVYANDGDEPENVKARQVLTDYQAGYYMADLDLRQGDRGRMEFGISKLTPINAQPKATV